MLLLFKGHDFFLGNSWVEEGVDTVNNGVLLLFAEDKFFLEILGGGEC